MIVIHLVKGVGVRAGLVDGLAIAPQSAKLGLYVCWISSKPSHDNAPLQWRATASPRQRLPSSLVARELLLHDVAPVPIAGTLKSMQHAS